MYAELGGTPAQNLSDPLPSQHREAVDAAGQVAVLAVLGFLKATCDAAQALPGVLDADLPPALDAGMGLASALLSLAKLSMESG